MLQVARRTNVLLSHDVTIIVYCLIDDSLIRVLLFFLYELTNFTVDASEANRTNTVVKLKPIDALSAVDTWIRAAFI